MGEFNKASRVVNVEDLRRIAKHRLPQAVFDYLDGGSEREFTLRENCRAFEDVTFRPRHAVSVPRCELRTQVLGHEVSLPLLLAPVGYSSLMYPRGEVLASRAAGRAGTAYILSTISGCKLEDVRKASSGPTSFQLYLLGGRAASEAVIARAHQAGYNALVVTIDTPVAGLRERDSRNGIKELLGRSVWQKLPFLPQILRRPGWLIDFLRTGGMPVLENVIIPGKGPLPLIDVAAALSEAAVTWNDLKWIRELWPGKIVVKGVMTAEDAQLAVDEGASAIVVSNHGGRQLDSVSSTIRVLPEIVDVVRDQAEVWIDGGIRSGGDIAKALCLGAKAVLCGRAYAYGLAAAGEPGVSRAIEMLRADLERTLRLLGCASVHELNRSYLNVPASWDRADTSRRKAHGTA
jgi:L-lactate dehydrogenase (cytochrome)